MAQDAIIIKLSDAALDELGRCNSREERGQKLLGFINIKADEVEDYFNAQLGGGLCKFERALLRTFLYREITGELTGEGDILDLPQARQAAAF